MLSLQSLMNTLVVIGGGAAGYFGAIQAAETLQSYHLPYKIIILESTHSPLRKVRISGGGRCNVTHACFDPKKLTLHYPRGTKELLSVFSRFQPEDTIEWFQNHGVILKTESDGRMFPTTDNSETIAKCLEHTARDLGIELILGAPVQSIVREVDPTSPETTTTFKINTSKGIYLSQSVLLATGSNPSGHKLAHSLGHTITPLAPSLFTFNIQDPRIDELAGVSFEAARLKIQLPETSTSFEQLGPLLITHWGLSGPAVLKLSAFAARELQAVNYQAILRISLLPSHNEAEAFSELTRFKNENPKKTIFAHRPFTGLPRRYWERLVEIHSLQELTWANISNSQINVLAQELTNATFTISGKSTFKDEFVTCGGVDLKEVHFKTMESKLCPGLYFSGEVLDIDGITGGFNFQNAWSGSFIAGTSVAERSIS